MKSKKRITLLAVLVCVFALVFSLGILGACGNDGESGAPGNTDGQTAGGSYLYGTTAPAEGLGNAGDYYLDTESLKAYVKTADGEWEPTALYSGAGVPADDEGTQGDLYLDTAGGVLYQKGESLWSIVLKVKGRDGVVWFSGEGKPTEPKNETLLQDALKGDFYLDITTFDIYQKTTEEKDSWEKLGSFKGDKGDDSMHVFYGTGAPDDNKDVWQGAVEGDLYFSISDGSGGIPAGTVLYVYHDGAWEEMMSTVKDGEVEGNDHEHTLEKHEAKAATCTEAGNKEYWQCTGCHKLYSDEQAENETTQEAVNIAATGHSYEWKSDENDHWQECSTCGATTQHTAHNYDGWQHNDTEHWQVCPTCQHETQHTAHTGGTATADQKAKCDVCGTEYGNYAEETPGEQPLDFNGESKKYGASLAAYGEGQCTLQSNESGLDGQFLGGILQNAAITYTINSSVAGTFELRISVAGGSGSNEWNSGWAEAQEDALEVFVGEESLGKCKVGPTEWTGFYELSLGEVTLNEGENTIKIVCLNADSDSNAGFNFNYLLIEPVAYDGSRRIYGAALAAVEGGGDVQGNVAGYDGNIIGGIQKDAAITYTIDSSVDGTFELRISVAGGSGNNQWNSGWAEALEEALEVSVNGVSLGKYNVGPTEWTGFYELFLGNVVLSNEKENTIKIVFVNANYNCNFNYLLIEPAKVYNGSELIYGAASATVEGGCSVQPNGAGYDGNIVGSISDNSVIRFTVESAEAATVTLSASLAGGIRDENWAIVEEATEAIEVWVNGTLVGKISVRTNDWTDFAEIKIGNVSLQQGSNMIELRAVSTDANFTANFNYLKVAPPAEEVRRQNRMTLSHVFVMNDEEMPFVKCYKFFNN